MNNLNVFKHMPIVTDVDVPGKTALILTFDCGCDLRCYHCHYFDARKTEKIYTFGEALNKIIAILKTDMIETIVLTGGEFLGIDGKKVAQILEYFTTNFPTLDIVINTNGTSPSIIRTILDTHQNISFHVDAKSAPDIDNKITRKIIGSDPNYYIRQLAQTLDIIYADSGTEHLVRTVEYPINDIMQYPVCGPHYFTEIVNTSLKSFEVKYDKKIIRHINPFMRLE